MFRVGPVEYVVHAGRKQYALDRTPSAVERKHPEPRSRPDILTDDVALVDSDSVLRGDQAPQRTERPGLVVVAEPEACFQRRQLGKWQVVGLVVAAHIGKRGIGSPRTCEPVGETCLGAPADGVDTARDRGGARAHAQAEFDDRR